MTSAWPLYGHDAAEASFLASATTGKLHHGWLIEGPSGIGKATMAKRLAAYMLGARGPETSPLDADPSDPVARTCLAGGHPDLRVVHRELNDKGKLRQDITVDQIRELTHFFSLKPAQGGWRVGIIDSLDELNRNGANALLKTLEEPPGHSILFLVNHGTTPILPTIRSRCRVLRVSALSDEDTKRALETADVGVVALKCRVFATHDRVDCPNETGRLMQPVHGARGDLLVRDGHVRAQAALLAETVDERFEITLDEEVLEGARLSLERMMAVPRDN